MTVASGELPGVVHLSWEYPPRVHGGLGRHVHALAHAQAAVGHQVTVVARAHPDAPSTQIDGGVRVLRIDEGDPHAWPADGAAPSDWLDLVDAFNVAIVDALPAPPIPSGVVHAHDWMVGRAARALRTRWAVPLVATIHNTERTRHPGGLPDPIARRVDNDERTLVATADRLVVCSDAMRAHLVSELGADPDRLDVVGGGVDSATFDAPAADVAAWRREAGTDGLVAFAGRLEHEKGVDVLLAALARLASRGRDVRLVIAGSGTQGAALAARGTELGIADRVSWAGFLPSHRVAGLLASADVACVPSRAEPFGLVALEAMAVGAPLVASRVGGLAEVVEDGRTGRLVAPDDPDALALALESVLDDPGMATAQAAAAQAVAASRGWEHSAGALATTYRRTLLGSTTIP